MKCRIVSCIAVSAAVVIGCSSPSEPESSAEVAQRQSDGPAAVAPPAAETPPATAPLVKRPAVSTSDRALTAKGEYCAGKACGTPCPSMFGSPVPTFCDGAQHCRPGKPVCAPSYDCDLSQVKCEVFEPACPAGMTVSAAGACYGPCVPVTSCKCVPGKPTECPEGYVCHASTMRCGLYDN